MTVAPITPQPENPRCPLGRTWIRWTLRDLKRLIDDRKAQQRQGTRRYGPVYRSDAITSLTWTIGPGQRDAQRVDGDELWGKHHRHTEFVLDGCAVHIDVFGGNNNGPGFGFRAIHVYVDEELRARACHGGCALGFGIGGGSALAPVTRLVAVQLLPLLSASDPPQVTVHRVVAPLTPAEASLSPADLWRDVVPEPVWTPLNDLNLKEQVRFFVEEEQRIKAVCDERRRLRAAGVPDSELPAVPRRAQEPPLRVIPLPARLSDTVSRLDRSDETD